MKTIMVIPTYWGRDSKEGWQVNDDIYDHPTPLNEEGTLARTLKSINILNNKDFDLIIPIVTTTPEIREKAYKKVKKIVQKINPPIKTYLFSYKQLEAIKNIYNKNNKLPETNLLKLKGYSNVRNMCLYPAYILGAEVVVLIDDDEIFEDQEFMSKAREFIGGRFYGLSIDGIAGYYLNSQDEYYDDVKMEPWMTFWDRFGSKAKAFDKVINKSPRLKSTPFAFGGCMVIHRSLMKVVPFDPNLPRGEDIDYVINSRMFNFNFFLDNQLNIKHKPPSKHHPIWQRLRQDIFRFYYEREKIRGQYDQPNMLKVEPKDFDPYPGEFLKDSLEDEVFKTNILLALDYLSQEKNKASESTIKNIYLSKHEAIPKENVFENYLKIQKQWENLLTFASKKNNILKKIIEQGNLNNEESIKDDKFHFPNGMTINSKNIEKIASYPFFSTLEKGEIRKLLKICSFKHYKKNKTIVEKGDKDLFIYIIIKGKVKIIQNDYDSNEEILLGYLKEGEHFGETSLFSSKSDKYLVQIISEETTEILELKRDKLLTFFSNHHRSSIKLLLYLSKKLNDRLEELTDRFTDHKKRDIDLSQKFEEN